MKISHLLALALWMPIAASLAQVQPAPLRPAPAAPVVDNSGLTRFDLDFPGGTPKELVAAIQKATGKPLNVIVPEEYADTMLPVLRMKNVDAWQLFQALQAASEKAVTYSSGSYYGGGAFGGYKSFQQYRTSVSFKFVGNKPTDDTIWYFYVDRPALPEGSSLERSKVCRFYALAPYLNRDLSVDDITTAIETGWKMLGEPQPAVINFHKDTKLLIAVGAPGALETIDAVLKALDLEEPKPAPPTNAAPRLPQKPAPPTEN
jgi:hypothetical protein